MESHEWRERTDEGNRYYRGNYHGDRWTILVTSMKRDPVWEKVEQPTEEIWRALRDVIWRKYQRKRGPWERIADLDKMLGDEPTPRGH